MSRARWSTVLLPLVLMAPLAAGAATPAAPAGASVFVERLHSNPLANPRFRQEGDVAARFTWLEAEKPRFPGDRPGTLRVLYDTTLATGRLSAPIGTVLSTDAAFEFGAILTLRSAGFHADPQGFSQIAFGLWNGHTTGLGRTVFPSDTFDLIEADYFANVTDFGGPFLSPSVFGGAVDTNAFDNFAFQSAESALPFDTPLLVRGTYDPLARRLTLEADRWAGGVFFAPIPGAVAVVDLSRLDPAFLTDVIGIAAYGEGWPSLHAEVDYDVLYVGGLPAPFRITTDGPRRDADPAPGRGPTSSPGARRPSV